MSTHAGHVHHHPLIAFAVIGAFAALAVAGWLTRNKGKTVAQLIAEHDQAEQDRKQRGGPVTPYIAFAAFAVVLAGGIALAFRQERAGDESDDRSRNICGPAIRRYAPGLPADGRPLSPGEWQEFVGLLFASDARHEPAEPDYGGHRG